MDMEMDIEMIDRDGLDYNPDKEFYSDEDVDY